MSIAVECPGCHTIVRVADELAGRKGACKQCGTVIRIGPPSPSSILMSGPRTLADATPQDMVQELSRRGAAALLTLFDPVRMGMLASDSIKLSELIDSGANLDKAALHLATDRLDAEQIVRLLKLLLEAAEQRLASKSHIHKAAAHEGSAFKFKDDALGLKLADFKAKYHRPARAGYRKLPWCSDESPNTAIPELLTEPWHGSVGIVHARIDAPSEGNSPTIAGIPSDLVLYQFVDGALFQILILFGTDNFHVVAGALRSKYGAPANETDQPRQLTWWNLENSIELTFGRLSPRAPAVLRYFHDGLSAEAKTRQPQRGHDI
jgi:hypothetical protein